MQEKISFKCLEGSAVDTALKNMFNETSMSKSQLVRTITDSMVRIVADVADGDKPEGIPQFVEHISDQLLPMGKKYQNLEHTDSFSPTLLSLAFSIWSHSKRAYNYIQKSNVMLLPHPRTLYHIKKERK